MAGLSHDEAAFDRMVCDYDLRPLAARMSMPGLAADWLHDRVLDRPAESYDRLVLRSGEVTDRSRPSADDGHRALGVGRDVLADRAEHEPREAAVAARADHEHVGL